MTLRWQFAAALTAAIFLLVVRAQAHTPGDEALAGRLRPLLRLYDGTRYTPGMQALLSERHAGLRSLRDKTGVDWWARWNEDFQAPRIALAAAAPVREGTIDERELVALARATIGEHGAVFGVQNSELELFRVRSFGALRLVQFQQQHAGIPVYASFFNIVYFQRADALVLTSIGGEVFPDLAQRLADRDVPRLSLEEISARAHDWVGRDRVVSLRRPVAGHPTGMIDPQEDPLLLEIAARRRADNKGVEPTVVYRTWVEADAPRARYEVLIDAITGEVIGAYDTICEVDLTGTVQGWASPNLLPDVASNPETLQPLPSFRVTVPGAGTTVTTTAGSFVIPYPGTSALSATLTLIGPWVNVNNSGGVDESLAVSIVPGTPANIVFNPTQAALVTSQVNGFIHTVKVHDFLKAIDPGFTDMDFAMNCFVNVNDNCNAYYDGNINFFLAGSGCASTAYSTIVYHEYGHGVLDEIFPFGADGAYNEGQADACCTLCADNPRLGAGLTGPGSYIRDVELQFRSYPQDLGLGVHESGLIVGGAFWDTLLALNASVGHTQALALCRQYYLHHLFFLTGNISPLLTIDVLTVDDNDGNLLNGTPHYAEINAGFGGHGLDAPDLQYALFDHTAVADTASDSSPYAVVAAIETTFGSLATASLFYRVGTAGGFTSAPLVATGTPNEFGGVIPPAASPSIVQYYLRATDSLGNSENFPAGGPANPLSFFVGLVTDIYLLPIGGSDAGWTHVEVATQDDWQRGAPNQQGANVWDPLTAFSPPNVWGNDLAPPSFNGDYQNNVGNYLESPVIDCSGHTGVRLQLRRWLTVEKSQYDQARITVNGVQFFQNDFAVDNIDSEWIEMNVDISAVADNNPNVRVRFSLTSDGGLVFGGWNIDDVRLVTVAESTVFAMRVPDAFTAVDAPVALSVLGTWEAELLGYTVALDYDEEVLSCTSLSLAGTTAGALQPDFFLPTIDNSAGVFVADVLLSFTLAETFAPAVDSALVAATFMPLAAASPTTSTTLALANQLGFPPSDCEMLRTGSVVVAPALSPGTLVFLSGLGATFIRGDSNGDDVLDVSDPLHTLLYLFAFGAAPPCLDAADSNDSGDVNIPDAVYTLNYLFAFGPPLPAPFPTAGADPTTTDGILCTP
ncbi:MAG: hypothetical protein ACKVX7_09690 [Planctomycetota bacterium]